MKKKIVALLLALILVVSLLPVSALAADAAEAPLAMQASDAGYITDVNKIGGAILNSL